MNAHHLHQLVHLAQCGNLQASLQCTDVRPAGAHIKGMLMDHQVRLAGSKPVYTGLYAVRV